MGARPDLLQQPQVGAQAAPAGWLYPIKCTPCIAALPLTLLLISSLTIPAAEGTYEGGRWVHEAVYKLHRAGEHSLSTRQTATASPLTNQDRKGEHASQEGGIDQHGSGQRGLLGDAGAGGPQHHCVLCQTGRR